MSIVIPGNPIAIIIHHSLQPISQSTTKDPWSADWFYLFFCGIGKSTRTCDDADEDREDEEEEEEEKHDDGSLLPTSIIPCAGKLFCYGQYRKIRSTISLPPFVLLSACTCCHDSSQHVELHWLKEKLRLLFVGLLLPASLCLCVCCCHFYGKCPQIQT